MDVYMVLSRTALHHLHQLSLGLSSTEEAGHWGQIHEVAFPDVVNRIQTSARINRAATLDRGGL